MSANIEERRAGTYFAEIEVGSPVCKRRVLMLTCEPEDIWDACKAAHLEMLGREVLAPVPEPTLPQPPDPDQFPAMPEPPVGKREPHKMRKALLAKRKL